MATTQLRDAVLHRPLGELLEVGVDGGLDQEAPPLLRPAHGLALDHVLDPGQRVHWSPTSGR